MTQRLAEELLTAISWIQPPFVDENTSPEEIRQRIALLLADKDRAVEYARKRGEYQTIQRGPAQVVAR